MTQQSALVVHVSDDRGNPLAGATVYARFRIGSFDFWSGTVIYTDAPVTATTDAYGSASLWAGPWDAADSVYASKAGYGNSSIRFQPSYSTSWQQGDSSAFITLPVWDVAPTPPPYTVPSTPTPLNPNPPPVTAPGTTIPISNNGGTYIVQSGDSLSGIAARFGTTVSYLMALNPSITDPNVIYIGQVIATAGNPPTAQPAPYTPPAQQPAPQTPYTPSTPAPAYQSTPAPTRDDTPLYVVAAVGLVGAAVMLRRSRASA